MGRNINSILKSASFSNPLSSCCWLVLWGKNGLNFWVCLHVLIYTKPIWHFPFFFYQPFNEPWVTTSIFHFFFAFCGMSWWWEMVVFPQATVASLCGCDTNLTKPLTHPPAGKLETLPSFSKKFTFFKGKLQLQHLNYGMVRLWVTAPCSILPFPAQAVFSFSTPPACSHFHERALCAESCLPSFPIRVHR